MNAIASFRSAAALLALAALLPGQGPTFASSSAWPDARSAHAMTYDEGRARTVLFGGRDGATLFGDTWEWDGDMWARFTPASSPSPRWGHAMAYDLSRGVTVLFGGCDASGPLGDTWEWDGRAWRQIVTANAPSPRHEHVMAGWVLYPSLDSHVVLFSGFRSNSNSYTQDTWTFDGTNWTQHAAPGPQARKNAAMACSATHGPAVMVGGYWGGSTLSDSWAWNGSGWIQLANGPAIHSQAMVFDRGYHSFVTLGGSSSAGPVQVVHQGTHTAAFTVVWSSQANTLPAAQHAACTYDTRRSRFVLFGGLLAQGATNALHEADYTLTFQPRAALAAGPSRRIYSAMVWDPGYDHAVVFGGLDPWTSQPSTYGDTWFFGANGWSQPIFSSLATQPSARRGQVIASIPSTSSFTFRGVVMHGGYDDTTGQRLGDFLLLREITGFPAPFAGWDWGGLANASLAAPSARADHAMIYDGARDRLLIYGGYGNAGPLSDTWEIEPLQGWPNAMRTSLVSTSGSPGARYSHAMAFDARRQRTVLFGGADQFGQFRGDTWEYDGASSTWTQVASTGPDPRVNHEMGFDAARGVVVLTGGRTSGSVLLDDVWEFDGAAWRQRDLPSTKPSPREGAAMTWDPTKRRFLLFGGSQQDTAVWSYTADGDRFADGMQGGSSPLRCTQFPVAGRETGFAFDSQFGFGWLALGFGASPVPQLVFDPPIACGGRGFVYPLQPLVVPVAGSPTARISFTMPNNMGGWGLTLQGLSLDLASACVRFTDPLAVTVAP